MRTRLDVELVRRGLARSREHAAALVAGGSVTVDGRPVAKSAWRVDAATSITAASDAASYVSRGALKLLGALDVFAGDGLTVAGARCLDAGASTGGFTQVLLERGARQVIAVDVGSGQLSSVLREDPRVVVREHTNARSLRPADIGGVVDLAVADLSFISLTLVLPALVGCIAPPGDDPRGGDLVVMVKPQFEVGRERLGAGGVVRDPVHRAEALQTVAAAAGTLGLGVAGATSSMLPGPAGNVEYFLWLRRDAPAADPAALISVVSDGPA